MKVAVERITYIQTPVRLFMTGITNYYLKAPVVCINTPSQAAHVSAAPIPRDIRYLYECCNHYSIPLRGPVWNVLDWRERHWP